MKGFYLSLIGASIFVIGIFMITDQTSAKPLAQINSIKDVESLFQLTERSIPRNTEQYIEEFLQSYAELINTPITDENAEQIINDFDQLMHLSNLTLFVHTVSALEHLSPQPAVQAAAHDANKKISEVLIDCMNNRQLYDLLQKCEQSSTVKNWSPEKQYYLRELLDELKRNGLELSEQEIAHIKGLKKTIEHLCLDFEKNIASDNRCITATAEQLVGASAVIARLTETAPGVYKVGIDYPTLFAVLEDCTVEDTRKRLYHESANRGYPKNSEVLKQLVQKRADLAHALGFNTFSTLDLDDQMVKTPQHAHHFLDGLLQRAKAKQDQEFHDMTADLPAGISLTADGKLEPWSGKFVFNHFKQKKYALDEVAISEYFPLEHTLDQLLKIYEQFLTVKFERVPSTLWHPEATMIAAYDGNTNQLLGYLILDLHPRDNKFSHAAQMSIVPATYHADGTPTTMVGVVMANFPASTAERPALLKRSDVKTFFHEFGHLMHALFGRTQLAGQSGTHVKHDFVEMPSQMLEEWLYTPEILRMISSHYVTGKPLPEELITTIINSKNIDSGSFVRRQGMLSLLSLDIFDAVDNIDAFTLYNTLSQEFLTHVVHYSDDHMPASFGHLAGYGAKYYGYLWSKVFALDLFDTIKQHGLLNADIGTRYRDTILAAGGSTDPNVLLEAFLGRTPTMDAFLKDMGI